MIGATGLGIERARAELTALLDDVDEIDYVVDGGPRHLPPSGSVAVYLQRSIGRPRQRSAGTVSVGTFDLPLLIEASADAENTDEDDLAADRAELAAVKDRAWSAAHAFADVLERDARALGVVDGDLVVTGDESGYVAGEWITRIWVVISFATLSGPRR